MVEGSESLCSGMKTLLEDNEQDPCLNFSIYHPIKTIEIKTEKCGNAFIGLTITILPGMLL